MKIFAEIGLNHCGSTSRGNNLIDNLVKTSVDGITFQIREKEFYDQTHPRRYELPISFYKEAVKKVHRSNKLFGLSISQIEKVEVFNDIGVNYWKTLSWDLTNNDLQLALQKTKKTVFISTGVSSMEEILNVGELYNNIELIHTQLDYSLRNVNLKAISTIRELTKKNVGFGLHVKEHDILYTAIGFEPSSLFFYVKDESNKEHPDDRHALSIKDVENYASNLRSLSETLGDGKKYSLKNKLHPDDDDICK